jgi:WD40 repeat protein
MRAAHSELLKRQRAGDGSPDAFHQAAEDFIRRGRASGALLDEDDERWEAQGLLDYWGTRLYRPGYEPPDATLADFDPELAPELPDELCPYVGLDAFREANRNVFFGRERLVNELVNKLRGERLLAVLGASGSGKSSVVRAGLIPALEGGALERSADWFYFPPIVPGSHPLANLARLTLPPNADPALVETEASRYLADQAYLAKLVAGRFTGSVVLVIDQFEEVFTLCSDDEARLAFVNNLSGLAAGAPGAGHIVILTMRTDFETNVARLPDFLPLFEQAVVRAPPLSAKELREAIEAPARMVGLKFEEGVVEALVGEVLGEEAALPLLQFTLLKLWERRERNRVTWEAYRKLGGGRQALARAADEFYDRLIPEEQVTAKRLLLKLVRPGEGKEVTSNRVRRVSLYTKAEASDRIDRVLDKFLRARLLRFTEGDTNEDDQVEVAHEALVRNWPRLAGWLDDERAEMRRRLRLTAAAEQWNNLRRDPGALLRGLPLAEASQYDDLSPLEAEFVAASRSEAEHEEAEREAQRQRELDAARLLAEAEKQRAEAQTRAARELRRRAFALAGALVGALVMFGLAVSSGRVAFSNAATAQAANTRSALQQTQLNDSKVTSDYNAEAASTAAVVALVTGEAARATGAAARATGAAAETARATAEAAQATAEAYAAQVSTEAARQAELSSSGQLAAQAVNSLASDPAAALLLSLEAYRVADTVGARSALLTALQRGLSLTTAPYARFTNPTSAAVYGLTISHDGRLLATGSADGAVVLWDAEGRTEVRRLLRHRGRVYGLSFSPDDTVLATAGADGAIILWDVASGNVLQQSERTSFTYLSLAFSPVDGNTLALGTGDGHVLIWDVASRETRLDLLRHTFSVWSVAWSPDGQQLASGSADGNAILWEPATGAILRELRDRHGDTIRNVAWSPDGRALVTASRDTTLIVWDVRNGAPLGQSLTAHDQPVLSVAFSRDGKLMASGDEDGTVILWDMTKIASPTVISRLTDQVGWIIGLAFSPGGPNLLASAGTDRTTVLRTVVVFQPLGQTVTDQAVNVQSLAVNLQGNVLAAEISRALVVVDLTTNQRVGPSVTSNFTSAALSPDGALLAIGAAEGEIRVLNVATGEPLALAIEPLGAPVLSLAISPDNQQLAASRCDAIGELGRCDQSTIAIWDLASGGLVATLSGGHTDFVEGLAFDPSGAMLASGSRDTKILLWDVASGQPLSLPLAGHSGWVTALVFSPDGLTLASGGFDGRLLLWDVTTGQLIGVPLTEFGGRLTALAFSPDGQTLYSGTADGTVSQWEVGVEAWSARACALAGRNLTQAEWEQFFPGRDYASTCPDFPPGT